ncbi:MAG: ankyrin repeat domain-containing protein [Gemmatimonadota bacterium]|nr:ankyrin repeat domain-containing protein [Gemmatimonadota bacterium]MDE2985953.1 ankyrin repeat domain-containing protein [Gemmatimonadota bacterium]
MTTQSTRLRSADRRFDRFWQESVLNRRNRTAEQRRPQGRRFAGLASLVVALSVTGAAGPADSPVADAAERGDVKAVRALLRDGADVNTAQSDGMTALHWAATRNDAEIAGILLYAGATTRATTRLGGYTPLHVASRSGSTTVAELILAAGADPNVFTTTGVTAMHFAADADAAGVVALLAAHGADTDARDTFSKRTPLMFAAVRGADAALGALLEAGADPALQTALKDYPAISVAWRAEQQKRSRVRAAAEEPKEDEEEEERRVQVPQQQIPPVQPRTPARPAPAAANPATPADPAATPPDSAPEPPAEPPLKALSSIEQIGKQGGFTALHYAAREGHRSTASLLADAGADIDQRTGGDQTTPMLVAVINGNYDLARDLLERGADPNLVSDDGAAPLFATLNIEWSLRTWYPQPQAFRQQETHYLDFMRLLLEAGADPNQRTTTHIWYAAYNAGRMGVDFTGATPFWRAAYAVDVDAMRLLVEYGADPNIWTIKLPSRRFFGANVPPQQQQEERADPSGLPPVPDGGPAIHPLHAASGVGFGTSRVAQQHRSVPDGWLPAVRYLVDELGMDPNLRDKDGYTAIHHAAARGDNATILFLVSRGADVNAISRRGQTTADLANSPEQRAQPHPATVALLEKLGSKNNHQCRTCGSR